MKFNTFKTYTNTAAYRPWEPLFVEADQLTYRDYGDAELVQCNIIIAMTGTVNLLCDRELQPFAIVHDLADAAGELVMSNQWYTVQRVIPVFDAFGFRTSYRHTLATLTPDLINEPINPPGEYPDLDQVS